MAYGALDSLAQTIDKILHHDHNYSIYPHEKQPIKSIQDHIIFLQAFLEKFPQKANSFEGRIRDVTNEAEDIIEHGVLRLLRQYKISKSIAEYESVKRWVHFDVKKLTNLTKEISSMAREVMAIKNGVEDVQQVMLSDSCLATSSLSFGGTSTRDNMVGFDEDLLAIKGRLCGESLKLQVIPITGMGGIGKTTLAKNAYDDPLIMEHFDIRIWVTISQDYSAQEILSSLLISIKAVIKEERDREQRNKSVEELVYKSLKWRRYLIVMDDMWSTKAWDDLKMIFPNDNNGSRIVLTTRLSDVAAYPDSSSPLHEMRFMGADQSWILLHQTVFKQEHRCPPELEIIGKNIARSCRGLPLAIVVIGGLLSTVSKTQASWEDIARNVSEAVATNDEQFAKRVLSLSYNHLPQHLRSCFLYIGSFPEDYEVRVSKLIKLWVAEGFPKPSRSKSLEEVAEEYFADLVKRSLVLVKTRKSDGKIKSCSVHDLVRDLCIKKSQEDKFFLHVMDRDAHKILPKTIKNQRRVSILHVMNKCAPLLTIYEPTSIRTVLYFQQCDSMLETSESFRFLRILDGVRVTFWKFPDQVLELFHLRYLAFTYMCKGEFDVPSSISKLQNLQTVLMCPYLKNYKSMRNKVRFPLELWKMVQLRHLIVFSIDLSPDIPRNWTTMLALRNQLQTLSEVRGFRCTERVVKMIPNLKKLGVIYNGEEDEIKWQIYHLDNLVHMHQLEKLKIWVDVKGCSLFWKNVAFPCTLKKLNLRGLRFCPKDISIVGSLQNLQVLKLRFCSFLGCKWETNEGEFPRLKCLKLIDVILQQWMVTESGHFPRLEHLLIYGCDGLDEIPDVIGEISTLELIEVDHRNKVLVESAKRIQEEQQSFGNDALQVRVLQ